MPEIVIPVAVPAAGGLEPAIVRVRGEDGSAVGAGILVAGRTVLTCAHVVQRAGSVRVEFPLLPDSAAFAAEVTALLPVLADGTGDIAVLTLDADPPPAARPAQMAAEDDLWGHPCRLFGFSGGREDGVWASGVLRGRQAAGWVQLESSGITGYAVEPGFSGAPVWDDELAAVVGMAVAVEVDGDLRAAYMIPTALLAEAWPALAEVTRPPCPYRGLAAFREQDAGGFFGREDRTAQLVREIDRRSFVAVVGPSGTGKSSLVFGGLLPVVHRRPDWVTATMRAAQASSGVAALAAALVPLLEPDQSETERLSALARLAGVLRDGHLRDVVSRILTRAGAVRLLLIVDQFEEVFASADAAELTGILLSGLGSGGVTAVITLRADFLGQALQLPALAEALGESVTAVGEMDRHRLRQVIEGPLPKGMAYEPGLVERILDDVGDQAGRLPLLEFALTLLWERQENRRLTHAAYQELGGVKGALARYAEQVYQEQVEPADREPFQRLLTQLVRPGESGEPVRRVARRTDLGEQRWQLGQRLAATRLVTAGRDDIGSETLELVHEALIDRWARLRQWADDDHAFRSWQEGVRRAVAEWEKLNRDAGALLRGVPLTEAVRRLNERDDDIAGTERHYIRASKNYQGRSIRTRWIAAALAVLMLAASSLGLLAVRRGRETARQAAESQARYLISQAQALNNSSDPRQDVRLLLSAAAYRFFDDDRTRANLTTEVSRYRYVSHLLPADTQGGAMAFSPSEQNVLAVRGADQIALWDVARRKVLRTTPVGDWTLGNPMAFSPAGDVLAFAENGAHESRLKLWRHATGDPVSLGWNRDAVARLEFSPDGDRLAACTPKGYQVWSLDPPTRPFLIPHVTAERGCLFAWTGGGAELTFADGPYLVTWTVSTRWPRGRVRIRLPGDQETIRHTGQHNVISSLSATADDNVVLLQGSGGFIWWDLGRGARLPGYGAELLNPAPPAFSADGRWAFFKNGALVRTSDRTVLRTVPIHLSGETLSASDTGNMALSSDGSTVAVGHNGSLEVVLVGDFDPLPMPNVGEFALWADGRHVTWLDVDNTATTSTLDPPRVSSPVKIPTHEQVQDMSDGGGLIAAIDPTHRLRVWDMQARPGASRVLTGPWRRLWAIALDDTGTFLAAADDSRAYVVNALTGAVVVSVPLGDGFFPAVLSLSPGGRYLFARDRGSDQSMLWRVSSGTARTVRLPDATGEPVFSPDGRWLALSTGNAVLVWDLAHQTVARRFTGTDATAFDRQGMMIAFRVPSTDLNDEKVGVRDLRNGHLVLELDSGSPYTTTFTADSTQLVTQDGDVLTEYTLDAEVALGRVCKLVGRELTQTEWQTYAGDFPYRRICT